jgi:hypothetical protein
MLKMPSWLTAVFGSLAPALIAMSSSLPALIQGPVQTLGILCAGLAGLAMPAPDWIAGAHPLIPHGMIAAAGVAAAMLKEVADTSTGLVKVGCYAAACLLAWAAGLHAPSPVSQGPAQLPPAAKAALAVFLCLGFLHSARAEAQVPVINQSSGGFDWALGPTLPAVVIDLKHGGQTSVAKGLGAQVSLTHDVLKKAFLGKSWDLLDLDVVAFGTLVNNLAGGQFGQLALGGGFGTLSNLLMIVGGAEVLGPGSPVPFIAFNLGFNFGFAPASPPTGVDQGPRGLVRGNTLYFGAP